MSFPYPYPWGSHGSPWASRRVFQVLVDVAFQLLSTLIIGFFLDKVTVLFRGLLGPARRGLARVSQKVGFVALMR